MRNLKQWERYYYTKQTKGTKMNKQQLEAKKKELEEQLKIAEANFHRISGALAFVAQQIAEEEAPKEEPKKDKK